MEQQKVFLTRFHYSNQIDYKIRPAVIVSNSRFNQKHNFVWACPITTKTTMPESELTLSPDELAGLREKSYIRSDIITSIDKDLFIKEIGKISNNLFEKLKTELLKNL